MGRRRNGPLEQSLKRTPASTGGGEGARHENKESARKPAAAAVHRERHVGYREGWNSEGASERNDVSFIFCCCLLLWSRALILSSYSPSPGLLSRARALPPSHPPFSGRDSCARLRLDETRWWLFHADDGTPRFYRSSRRAARAVRRRELRRGRASLQKDGRLGQRTALCILDRNPPPRIAT